LKDLKRGEALGTIQKGKKKSSAKPPTINRVTRERIVDDGGGVAFKKGRSRSGED